MININHLIIAAVLAIVLTNYVFPRMIYLMCEMILRFAYMVDLSKEKMKGGTNCPGFRLVFLILFLISWGMMIVVFVPMQVLTFYRNLRRVCEKIVRESILLIDKNEY